MLFRSKDVYVLTTLNQDLQEKAVEILEETIKANKSKNVTQGAIVAMNYDGEIKAMVGGVDYNKSQFNRATQALRQPGSAFKPFVYLTAIQEGFSPDDIIMDSPIKIKDWQPENADKKYHGEVSLTKALAKSLNLATINLSEMMSHGAIIKNAKKLGISTEIKDTPSLALGTFEVKVIDLATAYSVFANGGKITWPHSIKEIYSRDGYQLYQRNAENPQQIIKEKDAKKLTKMLEDVINSGTGKSAKINRFAAGKTGTSQDNRDAWFVGYDKDLIIAVWLGNDNNSPMKEVSGSNLPAKIWQNLMLNRQK